MSRYGARTYLDSDNFEDAQEEVEEREIGITQAANECLRSVLGTTTEPESKVEDADEGFE